MLYKERPDGFSDDARHICTCIVYHLDYPRRVLVMRRSPLSKLYANLWGFVCGKLRPGEHRRTAVVREVGEETGIQISEHHYGLQYIGQFFAVFPDGNHFVVELFTLVVWHMPTITLSLEHDAYDWVTKQEMLTLDYVPTNDLCLDACHYPEFQIPNVLEHEDESAFIFKT